MKLNENNLTIITMIIGMIMASMLLLIYPYQDSDLVKAFATLSCVFGIFIGVGSPLIAESIMDKMTKKD